MKLLLFFTLGLLAKLESVSTSSKILFLLPIATKSHKNVFDPLINSLGERGHEITVISPVKTSKSPNVREIVPRTLEEVMGTMTDAFELRRRGNLAILTSLNLTAIDQICSSLYEMREVQGLMKDSTFDLIIVNGMLNQCSFGLIWHFKCPHILLTAMPAPSVIADRLGNKFPPSFVPEPFMPFTHKMSFLERVLNVLFGVYVTITGPYYNSLMEAIYRKYVPNAPSIVDIDNNATMLLMNSHFTITYPRPLLPNVVEVGGMQCQEGKPLPKEMEEFLSGGKDGFILFSLGSIVKANNMPEETRKVFVNVFSRLKQRVIWKWEEESMPDLPPNVKLSKWLPQQDILAHKNIRIFMTHGGLLSTQEATFHGVPLIGFPFFADQDMNMAKSQQANYALTLEILTLTEEKLENAIREILRDPRYKENAAKLSKMFRDQPQKPLERAIYWIEYVIRHQGAVQLRSAAKDLNFLQYHCIDVILFLGFALAFLLFLIKLTVWNILIKRLILFPVRKLGELIKGTKIKRQ